MVARATLPRKASKKQYSTEPFSFVLFLIGLFKLFKAALLIAIGIGAIKFLHKDLANTVLHWAQVLRVDPDNRYHPRTLVKIFRVTPKQLEGAKRRHFHLCRAFSDGRRGPAAAQTLGGIFHHHHNRCVYPARDL